MIEPIRVLIVGCGGIGTWLSQGLARSLEFQAPGSVLVLVDGDNFEDKNVERQIFEIMGNKAHATRETLQPHVPGTFVVSEPSWVVPEEELADVDPEDENAGVGKITARELMNEGDYVFAVVDNFAARKLILDAAKEYDDIDVFVGGNDDKLFGTAMHYCRRNGEDVTVHPGFFHDEFVNPPDKNPGELSCAERAKLDGGTQLLAVNFGVVAQLMARASYWIFGNEEQKVQALKTAEVYFDMADASSTEYERRTEYGMKYCEELLEATKAKDLVST